MINRSIKLYNTLYGVNEPGVYFRELGTDSEESYLKNLKSQPDDWIYRTKKVSYLRNSLGHRSKEPHEIQDNFILFTGCSITEGVAIALEDTFSYKLSKNMNLDYYNLGIGSCGIDLMCLNLSLWFQHVKKVPKLVVLQWPEPSRRFEIINNEVFSLGPWSSNNKNYRNEVLGDSFNHYSSVLKNITYAYLNYLKIPYVEFSYNEIEYIDWGRDLRHPGIETNEQLVNLLHNKIQSL